MTEFELRRRIARWKIDDYKRGLGCYYPPVATVLDRIAIDDANLPRTAPSSVAMELSTAGDDELTPRTVCDVRLTLGDEVFNLVGLSEFDARRMHMCADYDVRAEIVAQRKVSA